jgi:hypothetical protein
MNNIKYDDNSNSNNSFQIKFFWRSPLPSECKRFNGELTGFHYILKGDSPWVRDEEERSGITTDNSAEFQVTIHYFFY